jgi:geranylgeranyl pyrophosphate synthase
MSVPLIRALSMLEASQKEALSNLVMKKENSQNDIQEAVLLIKETDALDFSKKLAENYADKARLALEVLSDSDYKDNLNMLIDVVMERDY